MAKTLVDAVLDVMIDYIANNCDEIFVDSAQATTYAEAQTTFKLAPKLAIVTGIGGGVYTKGNGATGRMLTVAAITGLTNSATGTATHLGLCKNAGSVLLGTNTLTTSTALTINNKCDLASWTLTIADPV